MPRPNERTDHCRAQAAKCASAAAATAIMDVREAYLNLEQGWLQLVPEIEGGRVSSISADRGKSDQDSGQPPTAPQT
jgi:hypothetical protein